MLKLMMVMGLAALTSLTCWPQSNGSATASTQTVESSPKKFYQLSFEVRELENERAINSRSYSMILRSGTERGSIRAGEKVPFASSSGVNTQWQQINVGVNIDCRKLEEAGDHISMQISAEITSIMEGHEGKISPIETPIIRNNSWDSTVNVPVRQPTILFSSDDPASKRKMQLQLTVTPIR